MQDCSEDRIHVDHTQCNVLESLERNMTSASEGASQLVAQEIDWATIAEDEPQSWLSNWFVDQVTQPLHVATRGLVSLDKRKKECVISSQDGLMAHGRYQRV